MRPPWRAVEFATEHERSARRPRRGGAVPPPSHAWRWRLRLACGHLATRPCRSARRGGEVVNVPAPRKVRCQACGAAGRP